MIAAMRAIGVAGFLHAMLREGEHIQLATQSMMVGNYWMIAGVRVDPEAVDAPFVLPSASVTILEVPKAVDGPTDQAVNQ